jgi:PKHD-type hydroxylase
LAAGDLIVYSSTLRHRVNPITRGERFAGVFWIQSLIREDTRRAQLFELDGTIRRLRQTGADPESLVRLTAHYHALLKAWTEI